MKNNRTMQGCLPGVDLANMKDSNGETLHDKRVRAGRKGGKTTVKRKGKRYMKKLAKYGAHVMHATYAIHPFMQSDYALVHRQEGKVKALLSGKPLPNRPERFVEPRRDADPLGLGAEM